MSSLTPDMQSVLERLENLERWNKRLKLAGSIVLLVLFTMVLMVSGYLTRISPVLMARIASHRIVEANAFYLVDENGHRRAELSMKRDEAQLSIYQENHEAGIFLHGAGNGESPFIELTKGSDANSFALIFPNMLHVSDDRGFSSMLGVSRIETTGTGEYHETSAASLTLFQKGILIWQAP